MNAWTHGRMDAWTHGRMDAWTHGRMDAWREDFKCVGESIWSPFPLDPMNPSSKPVDYSEDTSMLLLYFSSSFVNISVVEKFKEFLTHFIHSTRTADNDVVQTKKYEDLLVCILLSCVE